MRARLCRRRPCPWVSQSRSKVSSRLTSPSLPRVFLETPLAHRALHDVAKGRAENSFAAIEAAIDAGYGIEIDVQLTADDQALVFHDYALERLTDGNGTVRQFERGELASISLLGGGEAIPDLGEVLALVAGQVPLLIEIKDQDRALGDNVGPLEQAVAAAVAEYAGPVAVMSFNPESVAVMQALVPHVPRGLTTDAFLPDDWSAPADRLTHLAAIPDFDRVGAQFISHNWHALDMPRVQALKADGAAILCWTVRSAEDEGAARRIADNITFEGYPAPFGA